MKAKKQLEKALRKTDELPESWFGTADILADELPSVQRSRRVRKNIYIEQITADALEQFCSKHNVSFTDVANDILTKFVKEKKDSKKIG